MRNLIPFLMLLSPVFAVGQSVPNGGFEDWILTVWSEDPEYWVTDNSQLQTTVSKDLEAYEGAFAMRVTARPIGVGDYGEASTLFEIDAVPAALNFYAKSDVEFGGVSVGISFFNNELELYTEYWFAAEDIPEYTFISMPLDQIGPVITHARITVSAQVGDLIAGTASISVDGMAFGEPMGLHYADRAQLKLFPNPTQGVLNSESGGGRIGSLSIYDMQGRRVQQANINQKRTVMDVHHLPKGQYIVVGEGDNSFTGKFVVE